MNDLIQMAGIQLGMDQNDINQVISNLNKIGQEQRIQKKILNQFKKLDFDDQQRMIKKFRKLVKESDNRLMERIFHDLKRNQKQFNHLLGR